MIEINTQYQWCLHNTKKQNSEKEYFYSRRKLSCSLDVEGLGCPEYLHPLVIWTFSRNSNDSSSIKGFINIDIGNIYLPREFHLRNKTNWFESISLRSILNLNNHTTALEHTKTMVYTISRKQIYRVLTSKYCNMWFWPPAWVQLRSLSTYLG